MLATLLLAINAAWAAPTYAVFWSDHSTWVVELATAKAVVSPELITADDRFIWRYRLRTQAQRESDQDGAPAVRWQGLERIAVGVPTIRELTPAPAPDGSPTGIERRVVSFDGERLTMIRSERRGARHTIAMEVLALPTGEPVADAGQPAVDWLRARFPGLIHDCVDRSLGRFDRRGTTWWALGGRGECSDRLHALPIGASPEVARGYRVVVRGASESAVIRSAQALDEGCLEAQLWLEGPGGARALGPGRDVSGLRLVNANDPVVALATAWFRPLGQGRCDTPLRLGRTRTAAHLCLVDETERAWAGPEDLAATVRVTQAGSAYTVQVLVDDDEATDGDRVRFWLGSGRRPLQFQVGREGFKPLGRGRRKRQVRAVDATVRRRRGGYQVTATVPERLIGSPPSLTVRVDDDDGAGAISLWAGGARIDRRARRATPLEVR